MKNNHKSEANSSFRQQKRWVLIIWGEKW